MANNLEVFEVNDNELEVVSGGAGLRPIRMFGRTIEQEEVVKLLVLNKNKYPEDVKSIISDIRDKFKKGGNVVSLIKEVSSMNPEITKTIFSVG